MYYSLIDGKLVRSSSIKTTPEGKPVTNFTTWLRNQTQEYRDNNGWRDTLIDDGFQNQPGYTHVVSYIDDGHAITVIHEAVPNEPEPERVWQLSKIKIREYFANLGAESMLDALLDSDNAYRNRWNDAVTLDDNNPMFLGVCQWFIDQGVLSVEQVEDIKLTCRSEYQSS